MEPVVEPPSKRLRTSSPADPAEVRRTPRDFIFSHAPPHRSRSPSVFSSSQAALTLQAAYRGYCSRRETQAIKRAAQAATRAAAEAARDAAALAARIASPEYRQLVRHCPDADPEKLAAVDATLASLVGLQPLKEYCASVRQDCLARAALGDAPLIRNVLVSGNLGTGKKLASDILCKLLRAIGAAKGMLPTQTTLEMMALDVRRDVTCVVVDGLERIEAQKAKVDSILANYPNHCFIFVGPTTLGGSILASNVGVFIFSLHT